MDLFTPIFVTHPLSGLVDPSSGVGAKSIDSVSAVKVHDRYDR